MLLTKSKLNSIEVLIFKALVDSNISHGEFLLINAALKEYDVWKKKTKIYRLNQFIEDFSLSIKHCYNIVWSVKKVQKEKPKSCKVKKRKNNVFTKICRTYSKQSKIPLD